MNDAPHPLLDVLVALFCRPGQRHADSHALHAAHLAWELASGQWVLIAGPDNRLWGWASWYLTDADGYIQLRTEGLDDLIRQGRLIPLRNGDHAYAATVITAPWAPAGTLRYLIELVSAECRSAGAVCLAADFSTRNGYARWHERRLNGFAR